jgi:hypothetical protein
MRAKVQTARSFQFSFPDVDTQLVVEEAEDKVIVRATRNTFSPRRKIQFLRFLAAEGFIPDRYQRISNFDMEGLPVCWLVEFSCARAQLSGPARTRKIVFRMLGWAVLLWLGLIAAISFRWI